MPYDELKQRIMECTSPGDQIRAQPMQAHARTFVINGEPCVGLKPQARRFRVDPKTVRDRLKAGWSDDQAFGQAPPPKRTREQAPITVSGIQYASVKVAWLALRPKASTPAVIGRMKIGWSPEEAFGQVPRQRPSAVHAGTPVTIRGVTYPSKSAAYRALKPEVTLATVNVRLESGWSVDRAFTEGRSPATLFGHTGTKAELVKVGGVTKTAFEHARARGLKWHTVEMRVKRGKSLAAALATPLGVHAVPQDAPCVYKITNIVTGKAYIGITVDLKQRTLQHFNRETKSAIGPDLKTYGRDAFVVELLKEYDTIEEAQRDESVWIDLHMTYVPHGYNHSGGGAWMRSSKPITVRGVEYPSLKMACAALDVEYKLAIGRVHDWRKKRLPDTPERIESALFVPRRLEAPEDGDLRRPCRVLGVDYPSIAAAARALKFSTACVGQWVRKGNHTEGYPERKTQVIRTPKRKPVTVLGVTYRSRSAAARALGMTPYMVAQLPPHEPYGHLKTLPESEPVDESTKAA